MQANIVLKIRVAPEAPVEVENIAEKVLFDFFDHFFRKVFEVPRLWLD